jgi:hypothetical protein
MVKSFAMNRSLLLKMSPAIGTYALATALAAGSSLQHI